MKVAVYTCTVGHYDTVQSPLARTPGCDFIHFSDQPRSARGWQHRDIPAAARQGDGSRTNRYLKLHHDFALPDVDLSIYVDGNVLILSDLTPLIEAFVASDADIALFPHSCRSTVREEIPFAIGHGKVKGADIAVAQRQLADYEATGVADLPLTQNTILFRRHGRPALDQAMKDWWQEMQRYVMRDQFSAPSVLDRSGVKIHYWDWDFFLAENPYFHRYTHLKAGARKGALAEFYRGMKLRAPYSRPHRIAYKLMDGLKRLSGLSKPARESGK